MCLVTVTELLSVYNVSVKCPHEALKISLLSMETLCYLSSNLEALSSAYESVFGVFYLTCKFLDTFGFYVGGNSFLILFF